jgi:hypothetical protein
MSHVPLQATSVKAQGPAYFQLANHKADYDNLDWRIQARRRFSVFAISMFA